MQINNRVAFSLIGVLTLAMLLTSCTTAAKEYTDLSQAGTMSQSLCYRVEHLPSDFEVIAKMIQDNAAAAKDSPDPQQRERDFADWGRVVGSFQQWAFEAPSTPDEDADGRMTDEEIEVELKAASEEMLEAPFTSATCRVDVYSTAEGAERAFQGELQDLKEPAHLLHVTVRDLRDDQSNRSRATVIHEFSAPEITKFIVRMRSENLVGQVSISSSCDVESGPECQAVENRVQSLGDLLHSRLAEVTDDDEAVTVADHQGSISSEERSLEEEARASCAPRDFSGCVDQYVEHAQAGEHLGLCRSEYGGWFFEPPVGEVGDYCSDDDYVIAAIIASDL